MKKSMIILSSLLVLTCSKTWCMDKNEDPVRDPIADIEDKLFQDDLTQEEIMAIARDQAANTWRPLTHTLLLAEGKNINTYLNGLSPVQLQQQLNLFNGKQLEMVRFFVNQNHDKPAWSTLMNKLTLTNRLEIAALIESTEAGPSDAPHKTPITPKDETPSAAAPNLPSQEDSDAPSPLTREQMREDRLKAIEQRLKTAQQTTVPAPLITPSQQIVRDDELEKRRKQMIDAVEKRQRLAALTNIYQPFVADDLPGLENITPLEKFKHTPHTIQPQPTKTNYHHLALKAGTAAVVTAGIGVALYKFFWK